MNTKKQLVLAWSIAAILGIALIISLFALMNPKKELGVVLSENQDSLTEQRDTIAAACRNEDTASEDACQKALLDLSGLLQEFSRELERYTPAQN